MRNTKDPKETTSRFVFCYGWRDNNCVSCIHITIFYYAHRHSFKHILRAFFYDFCVVAFFIAYSYANSTCPIDAIKRPLRGRRNLCKILCVPIAYGRVWNKNNLKGNHFIEYHANRSYVTVNQCSFFFFSFYPFLIWKDDFSMYFPYQHWPLTNEKN